MGDAGPGVERGAAGTLAVEIHLSRDAMAAAAARQAAGAIREAVTRAGAARVLFAAAPSQAEMLAALGAMDLPWERLTAFHIDDYLGLPATAPQLFGNWLEAHLFRHRPAATFHRMPVGLGGAAACAAYARLLGEAPVDLGLVGVGVNGHVAFNDPPVADFADPVPVKVVELEAVCRQQQVDDGCFADLAAVPTHAVTLTIPALMAARRIVCTVPGRAKHAAVARVLSGPIGTDCPATVLRRHPAATLFLDRESAHG